MTKGLHMIDALVPESVPASSRFARVVGAATLVAWVVIAALIAYSYVGDAPGPKGTCYAPNGRSVPCELVRK